VRSFISSGERIDPKYKMKASNEKSILCNGTYFLVLGFICTLLAPMFYSTTYNSSIVCPVCVILMCAPRLFYNRKTWTSVLLLICCILTSLVLLHFYVILILLSGLEQTHASSYICMAIITAIVLLHFYLCYRLYKLLFKTKPSV